MSCFGMLQRFSTWFLRNAKGGEASFIGLHEVPASSLCRKHMVPLRACLWLSPSLPRSFHIFASCCGSAAVGGLLTLVSNRRRRSCACISHSDIARGRVMRLELADSEARMVFWNIHNFGLGRLELGQLRTTMGSDLGAARDSPMQFSVVVAGDVNFLASGDTVFRPEAPLGAPAQVDRAARPGQAVLSALAARMVDITGGVHTHYCSAANSFSRLGRVLVSLPPWP